MVESSRKFKIMTHSSSVGRQGKNEIIFEIVLIKGWTTFFCRVCTVNILGIAGHTVSVAKAATGNTERSDHVCVP